MPSKTSPEMVSPVDPAGWWRYPCFAHERLIVTGDLPSDPEAAGAQLAEWRRLGVTHIVDVREEWSDASFVATVAPEITYVAAGCDDMGNRRSDEWFESVLDGLGDALSEPDAVVLVHCHMGVNRAPSMAVRLMLEQGWDAVDAVEAIRTARPIAALVYAQDAVDHYHREHGSSDTERFRDRRRVRDWLAANPVDVGWVITKIRRAEGDAR